jgi:CBS domain-containing protein
MRAVDIMTPQVIHVGPDTSVRSIAKLLTERQISGVPVVDSKRRVIGMVSEGDLLHRVETGTQHRRMWWLEMDESAQTLAREYVKSHGRKAKDVMTRDVTTVSVVVKRGIVHLWGTLPSEVQRTALRVAAETVPGVKKIVDHTTTTDAPSTH